MLTQLTPSVLQKITAVDRAVIKYRVSLDEEFGEPKSIDMCVPSSSSELLVSGIKSNVQAAYAVCWPHLEPLPASLHLTLPQPHAAYV
jgi:hypothetical protein